MSNDLISVTYPDGTTFEQAVTLTSTGTQPVTYEKLSTVPSFAVGDQFTLSGEIYYSFGGPNIGDEVLGADSTPSSIAPSSVPEPSSLILTVLGSLSLLGFGRSPLRAAGKDTLNVGS